jgi:hypothetical protein
MRALLVPDASNDARLTHLMQAKLASEAGFIPTSELRDFAREPLERSEPLFRPEISTPMPSAFAGTAAWGGEAMPDRGAGRPIARSALSAAVERQRRQ